MIIGSATFDTAIIVATYKIGAKTVKGVKATKRISKSQLKAIRSLEKQISKHEKKLADFKKNPTVRTDMENVIKEVIEKQQKARIKHLETEIQTFNI